MNPSIDKIVEEYKKFFLERKYWDIKEREDWLRSALSQARQEGRKEAVNYIKDNMMFGRDISKNLVFDPNEFTDLLVAALTTEGK